VSAAIARRERIEREARERRERDRTAGSSGRQAPCVAEDRLTRLLDFT